MKRKTVAVSVLLLISVLLCLLLLRTEKKEGAPSVPAEEEILSLTVALNGEKPQASDFLQPDCAARLAAAGTAVSFAEAETFDTAGDVSVVLLLTAANGRTAELTVPCKVVEDVTPPAFSGVGDLSVLLGEGIALRAGVSVTDDCFGTVTWRVDNGNLNLTQPGYYQIFYIATDAAGNGTTVSAYVTVYEYEVTEEMLRMKIEPLLEELCKGAETREDICRRVYAYVQSHIEYFVISDKTDYVRAGYDALFGTGRGDCFSYCAAARLLLEWSGVEVLPVTRRAGVTADTHYWLLCNLAAPEEAPRWYHLDATPLDEAYGTWSGCLLTDAQLAAYSAKRPHFYEYDYSAYPASAETVLTGW